MAAPCAIEDVSLDGLGLGDAPNFQNLVNLVSDPTNAIQQIKFESEWTPTITLDKPLAGPSSSGIVEDFLKPKITVTLSDGTPLVIAPSGYPTASKWPLIVVPAAILLGGGIIFAGFGLVSVLRIVLHRDEPRARSRRSLGGMRTRRRRLAA